MRRLLKYIVVAVAVLGVVSPTLEAKPKAEKLNLKRPLKVVCLGNSITHHGYLPDVEWYSDWGMAASKPENDYCHVLERELQTFNKHTRVHPQNIYPFERNPYCDIDSLIGKTCAEADIIILRICENVSDIDAFKKNFPRLVEYCLGITPHVIVSGAFWPHEKKERILVSAAERHALEFVPLSWITYQSDVYPKKGDILYDIDGKQYPITKEFIITHPNDKGMRSIATALLRAIKQLAR
ncbi:MAG: SGNH/GDSL hydrolase family protein [Alistipes sp.]|nr:SGNH/GDSL hydrolase family protein [Alistipes sp.]